jgi:hypothetical protein
MSLTHSPSLTLTGKLAAMFYDEKGLSVDVRDQAMKTKHK